MMFSKKYQHFYLPGTKTKILLLKNFAFTSIRASVSPLQLWYLHMFARQSQQPDPRPHPIRYRFYTFSLILFSQTDMGTENLVKFFKAACHNFTLNWSRLVRLWLAAINPCFELINWAKSYVNKYLLYLFISISTSLKPFCFW